MVNTGIFNETLGAALLALLPPSAFTDFVVANATVILTIILVVVVFGFLIINFLFDFITDIWKIPFAVVIDILLYFSLSIPVLALVGGVLGAFMFYWLADAVFWKFVFGLATLAIGLGLFFFGSPIFLILAILPLTTVMMFIDTIID